jgi:predicted ATP-grasp superfamily ATP-dependent carboligase
MEGSNLPFYDKAKWHKFFSEKCCRSVDEAMVVQINCALVLGGYVNGYSIIKELYSKSIYDIALFDYGRGIAKLSNKVKYYDCIDNSPDSLKRAIEKLHKQYNYIIIFPTDDLQIENLHQIYYDIQDFCFVPFNPQTILDSLDKFIQYFNCEKLGVPYPKTIKLLTEKDMEKISHIQFPLLLKPNKREDLKVDVFRSLAVNTLQEFGQIKSELISLLSLGISFIASEIIPGSSSNIYAYVGYRNKDGKILNEWTGKKLSQFPDDFGVFSTASNEAPIDILELGRKLLIGMDIMGIAEPEFKYDFRDGKYKLMEINLRSMMWNRVGNLSGVDIHVTQYLDATGQYVPVQVQNKTRNLHLVYMKHELFNLLNRRNYLPNFKYNVFKGDSLHFAIFDRKDIKPFIMDTFRTIKLITKSRQKNYYIHKNFFS